MSNKAVRRKSQPLIEALRLLLTSGSKASTQEELCGALRKQGYEVNQSKVSRLLHKMGATKVVNEKGLAAYSLPKEPSPLPVDTPIRNLVLDIAANEALVVVTTFPGAASMIARAIEYSQLSTQILGTIAGDDTIFIAPKSVADAPKLLEAVKQALMAHTGSR